MLGEPESVFWSDVSQSGPFGVRRVKTDEDRAFVVAVKFENPFEGFNTRAQFGSVVGAFWEGLPPSSHLRGM